jgi:hypothetical protein
MHAELAVMATCPQHQEAAMTTMNGKTSGG